MAYEKDYKRMEYIHKCLGSYIKISIKSKLEYPQQQFSIGLLQYLNLFEMR